MLGQEPHVQTVLNVRENQDVQEDLQEIDIGGTHHPTGVENEGELHLPIRNHQLESYALLCELSLLAISLVSIPHALNADLSPWKGKSQVTLRTPISSAGVIWCWACSAISHPLPISLYCLRFGPLKTVNLCMTNPHKDMISFFTHLPKKIPGFRMPDCTCLFMHPRAIIFRDIQALSLSYP